MGVAGHCWARTFSFPVQLHSVMPRRFIKTSDDEPTSGGQPYVVPELQLDGWSGNSTH